MTPLFVLCLAIGITAFMGLVVLLGAVLEWGDCGCEQHHPTRWLG